MTVLKAVCHQAPSCCMPSPAHPHGLGMTLTQAGSPAPDLGQCFSSLSLSNGPNNPTSLGCCDTQMRSWPKPHWGLGSCEICRQRSVDTFFQ